MSAVEKEDTRHDKRCGTTTQINLKAPELILLLNDNVIPNTKGKTCETSEGALLAAWIFNFQNSREHI
jgi:hypothetical protein